MEHLDEISAADSWDSLETLIRVEPLSVVVFNPAADGTMDTTRACRLIRRYSSIPFVAYVPLHAPFARAIAHMSNDGLQDLVVAGGNDSPIRLRETLVRVSCVAAVTELADRLEPWLQRLPGALPRVLVDALRQPHKYSSAENIAAGADMTVSGLYRGFRVARLNSPKSFVVGARVFRGYLYLRDAGFSIRDIAAKLGYTHPRIFAHQIGCILGERPSRVRYSYEVNSATDRMIDWFTERKGVPDDCFRAFGGEATYSRGEATHDIGSYSPLSLGRSRDPLTTR
jgi:AraC-like DNA-binding protein